MKLLIVALFIGITAAAPRPEAELVSSNSDLSEIPEKWQFE